MTLYQLTLLFVSCTQRGWTALMEASEEGDTEIIKLLLEAGATAKKTKKVMYTGQSH